ncbi:SUN domain-containing protein 1-like isoform X9 [Xyrichtys novacula]|uniref:SUN domain-containing protein 1-like isoform X9 n=1 Tax=Xyrichtys novacula TaxID=13765 RepID=A0AAV1H651_XYRNO|nr:SUN domain-containing protein 1-like isoform X9 [Xyrichtys novacula]
MLRCFTEVKKFVESPTFNFRCGKLRSVKAPVTPQRRSSRRRSCPDAACGSMTACWTAVWGTAAPPTAWEEPAGRAAGRRSLVTLSSSRSLHSVASDASLISSLLDESSMKETTLLDTLLGLDQDVDPQESTIIAEHSTVLEEPTLIGSDVRCLKHPLHALSKAYCKDCEEQHDRMESTHCSSSKYTSSSSTSHQTPDTSVIYSRDRSRKSRTGVLVSVWDRSAARLLSLLSLLSLLYHQLMQHKHRHVTGVLQPWLDWSLLCVRRAAACCVCVLTHTWQVCLRLTVTSSQVDAQSESRPRARSGHCGVMNLRESTRNLKKDHPTDGSLCKSAADVFTWLNRRWRHINASFPLTRFPLRLLLLLPLLLLLFSLCWFGPVGLQSVLPAVNISEWTTVLSTAPHRSSISSLLSSQSRPAEGAVEEVREVQPDEEPLYSRPPPADTESEEGHAHQAVRLVRLEQSLTALWERVEDGGRRAEQRHKEVLQLYADLQLQQQEVSAQRGGGGEEEEEEEWLRGPLEEIRSQLEEERRSREQTRVQDLLQQQTESSRLDQLELQLKTLTARTQEVLRRQEAAAASAPPTLPAAVSVGVDRQSHDALLAEVARLEAVLEDMRRDVEVLSGCTAGCRELDRIQQTVSAQVSSQVHEELRTLLYGNQLTLRGGASAELPESLLQWISQRYISEADLQEALSSLELRILRNVSVQLERRHSDGNIRGSVPNATEAAGAALTEKDVHVIVKNALRLFDQDRTGLADYALESGGGSILSTRCSQTYETKAALLSLFGVPLWYFSQSPRVVIQPDVHPGNCWAFKGSKGFLVIRLSMRILPTAVSLEHIPKTLAPSGMLLSAPRDFSVYGLDDEGQEEGKLLGTFTYDEEGESLQTYPVSEENEEAFQIIEVQVLSNWGHQDYTCLYRFRVHGTPADV